MFPDKRFTDKFLPNDYMKYKLPTKMLEIRNITMGKNLKSASEIFREHFQEKYKASDCGI